MVIDFTALIYTQLETHKHWLHTYKNKNILFTQKMTGKEIMQPTWIICGYSRDTSCRPKFSNQVCWYRSLFSSFLNGCLQDSVTYRQTSTYLQCIISTVLFIVIDSIMWIFIFSQLVFWSFRGYDKCIFLILNSASTGKDRCFNYSPFIPAY